ncbi:MAG: nucleotide exchange factor GrpE [Firmicutes bacterium]|nr:nucleotide exchange factor GrpE [Bacillota bacterium]
MTSEKPDLQEAEELKEEQAEAKADAEKQEAKAENEAECEGEIGEEPSKEVTAEDEALNVKYLRLMADFQNFKRRTEKEKSDIYAYANEKIVGELLDVIDNFERALTHGAAGDSFAEGMNMIFKQLQGVLEKANVLEIKAQGEDFDPNFHNAVMTEDSAEYESGKVTAVLQKGYTLNGKVIRPSMVKVAN